MHAAASSTAGSAALLSAITTAAKKQQAFNTILAALKQPGSGLTPAAAAAAAVAAVPGAMGRILAQQVVQQPDVLLQHGYELGLQLVQLADRLIAYAPALLDPLLAPAAAYLATCLPPGQNSQLWGLDMLLANPPAQGSAADVRGYPYRRHLRSHVPGIMGALEGALECHLAGPAAKQAAKLAKRAGGGAAEAEQLREQLQDMWLGRGRQDFGSGTWAEGVPQGVWKEAMANLAVSSSSVGDVRPCQPGELPFVLKIMCNQGIFQREKVLAAGDPAQWAAAVRPATPEDLQVAATALLMACKAAGAVAQLPQLLEQLQGIIMPRQPQATALAFGVAAFKLDVPQLQRQCTALAEWAVLLAPLLGLLLPAEQAAQLQEAAAGIPRDSDGRPRVSPKACSQVLRLMGHVAAPGPRGCSYPGCCNLEGRSEAELPLQVCSQCKGVRYCCREHQVAHWKAGHKEVCRAAQAAAEQVCDVALGGLTRGTAVMPTPLTQLTLWRMWTLFTQLTGCQLASRVTARAGRR
jgi:hypothetical protein